MAAVENGGGLKAQREGGILSRNDEGKASVLIPFIRGLGPVAESFRQVAMELAPVFTRNGSRKSSPPSSALSVVPQPILPQPIRTTYVQDKGVSVTNVAQTSKKAYRSRCNKGNKKGNGR
jgi:hypothetical protein